MQVIGVGRSPTLSDADFVIPGFKNLDFTYIMDVVCA